MSLVVDDGDIDPRFEAYLDKIKELPKAGLSPELEACAEELLSLLAEYGYSLRFAICLLDPIARLRLHVTTPPDPRIKKGRPVSIKPIPIRTQARPFLVGEVILRC